MDPLAYAAYQADVLALGKLAVNLGYVLIFVMAMIFGVLVFNQFKGR